MLAFCSNKDSDPHRISVEPRSARSPVKSASSMPGSARSPVGRQYLVRQWSASGPPGRQQIPPVTLLVHWQPLASLFRQQSARVARVASSLAVRQWSTAASQLSPGLDTSM